ncbi:MAG: oligosaccharide flippase family protein [Candidatus Daviesbacteria bacterium]
MQDKSTFLSITEIKKRILSSFMSLTARQIALRAISFITLNIVLARILPVETLGIFNIATAVITFFAFFSDIGLAASLIQKKESVTSEDVKTVFTIQQIVVVILSLAILLGAPAIGNFYKLDESGIWLVRVLGFSFFLSSLKVVPSVLLERELRFQPLVVVEIVETLIFNILLILLVTKDLGIWSFSIAALSRGIVGTILIYILAPAKIGFQINKESARQLLSFGIPYQANSFLAVLKDRLVPLVIARMVGPVGIGYITWAQAMAFLPLEVMNIVIRITFPAFSRLQDNKEVLGKAVEKSLFATSLLVYPALFGLGAILPSVVAYVVSPKWQQAVPSFYLFAFSTFWAVISTTFTNTLNATGYIKTTLKLMILWTTLTWLLTPLFVVIYGFIGVAMASFIISFTSVITIILAKKILVIKVLDAVVLPTIASLIMAIVIFGFSQIFVRNFLTLILAISLGGFIYFGIIILFKKELVLDNLRSLRSA